MRTALPTFSERGGGGAVASRGLAVECGCVDPKGLSCPLALSLAMLYTFLVHLPLYHWTEDITGSTICVRTSSPWQNFLGHLEYFIRELQAITGDQHFRNSTTGCTLSFVITTCAVFS